MQYSKRSTGFVRFAPVGEIEYSEYKGTILPRDEGVHPSIVYPDDYIDYIDRRITDKHAFPPLTNTEINTYLTCFLNMCRSCNEVLQREGMLSDAKHIQAAQRKYEQKLWTEFKREQAAIRKSRIRGMPLEVDNFFAGHSRLPTQQEERKKFVNWVAARQRVYVPV
jgi:hypothetical protein